jgi:hypothetical protein
MDASSCPFNNGTTNAGIAGALAALAYCQDIGDSIANPANGLPGWGLAWRADQIGPRQLRLHRPDHQSIRHRDSQTNLTQGSVALNTEGTLDPSNNQSTLIDWLGQAGWQHSMQHYLTWIRGSGTTCSTSPRNVAARDAAARRNPRTITALLDGKIRTLTPRIAP